MDLSAQQALASGIVGDPFSLLGPHEVDGRTVVRSYQPGALGVDLLPLDDSVEAVSMQALEVPGVFAGVLPWSGGYRLRVRWPSGEFVTEDPYSFGLLLGELDLYLLAEGRHFELGRCLGAHVMTIGGVTGTRFAVWAPNARRVSVVGDFNSWDGRRHPMRARLEAGVWELFIPRIGPGERYKYEILGPHGLLPLKADPIALQAEAAPATSSIVSDPTPFEWTDRGWMEAQVSRDSLHEPMSVYEVHAGSWKRRDGRPLNWEELADELIPYVVEQAFTHIELMPITVHPFGGSWGYQSLGLYAPTAEWGTPHQFARFVDRCHAAGIGVILDWVPSHFPTDAHGLARFDGTALYEHEDPREGFHQDWNTLIYNLGRREVRAFVLASALHWLEQFHVDALRVDAVASMLYRDYSRRPGEWIPNIYGGRENLENVSFLKELNDVVHVRRPGALVIAEESTAWPGVTAPTADGGLGFTYKWNMGWMHDTLHYMSVDPLYRSYDHHQMTFGLIYAFSERFVLPLSHDEVVHGKGSLIRKMPGDAWQKFANLRAYFGFMWSHPGKKLLFMGGEIGQWREWNHDAELDWATLADPMHRGVQLVIRDLNRLYAAVPALHRLDVDAAGFQWVVGDDSQNSVFAYMRQAPGTEPVLAVCNFTPVPRHGYRIGVPCEGQWREIFNSDAGIYGGSNVGNGGCVTTESVASHGQGQSLVLTLPPLATLFLTPERS